MLVCRLLQQGKRVLWQGKRGSLSWWVLFENGTATDLSEEDACRVRRLTGCEVNWFLLLGQQ